MPAAFETVDTDGVAADLLRLQGMANGCALVYYPDPGFFQVRQYRRRIVSRRFNDGHPALDDRSDYRRVIGSINRRQKRDINAEGLVRHVLATRNFIRQVRRRFLSKPGNDTEAAGIRYRCRQFGKPDIVHTPG